MKLGFIGAGRVGSSVGKLFSECDIEIIGYFSKSYDSALFAADLTKSRAFQNKKELLAECDVIFLTVPDGQISLVWDEIKKNVRGKTVCHMSGALSAKEAFPEYSDYGAKTCSVHPLIAVSDRNNSYRDMKKACFTVEGSAADDIKALFERAGCKVISIESAAKPAYHAAAAMASNLMISLLSLSCETLEACGFTEHDALLSLVPLVKLNIDNIFSKGFTESLTGPLERGDIETIKKHLNALSSDAKEAYIILSRHLLDTARAKNRGRDYGEIAALLERNVDPNEKHNIDLC